MSTQKQGCLICGKPLIYMANEKLECYCCHKTFDANAKCASGHFVCDSCHSLPAADLIETTCVASQSTDPFELALTLMHSPQVKMHGPEHHFLVPAVLLTAYYNTVNEPEKKANKIKIARQRAQAVLGGFCGFYGDCGAAVGTGIFISVITGATPLSTSEWRLSNLMTGKSLIEIANHGGPRCCKRNSFLALTQAVEFLKQNLNITLKTKPNLKCEFTDLNKECIGKNCPYNPT
jgi:hypothetical protein